VVSQPEVNLVLSNHNITTPWLVLANVAGLGSANVSFSLSNAPLAFFNVEYSSNLTSWLPLGPATTRYSFTDTNAPAAPQRFYRLRWP
jgi:hypothetical protein